MVHRDKKGLAYAWLRSPEDLPGLLEELDIPVIYARQYLKRYVIQEGTQDEHGHTGRGSVFVAGRDES